MAIGTAQKAGGVAKGAGVQVTVPGSFRSTWIQANDDARTAQSTLDVGGITDSTFKWVEVPYGATRALIRGRTPAATTATGTDPVVRIIGVYGNLTSNAPADGVPVMRLDNADADAAGITVTLDDDGTTVLNDDTWDYHNPTTLDGYDLKGAWYVGIQVVTAASITASAAVPIDILFLN